MNDLEAVLESVRDRTGRYRGQTIGEQNTKNVLIEPVLRALGWDVEDPDEVWREFRCAGEPWTRVRPSTARLIST